MDLTNNNYHEIEDLAKELHDMTKKGGTIKSGKLQMEFSLKFSVIALVASILIIFYSFNLGAQSLIPSEISIIIQEEQLAEFTRATIQAQVERLRMFTEVSPSI